VNWAAAKRVNENTPTVTRINSWGKTTRDSPGVGVGDNLKLLGKKDGPIIGSRHLTKQGVLDRPGIARNGYKGTFGENLTFL